MADVAFGRDEGDVAERLKGAGIGFEYEPDFIVDGKRPDFFLPSLGIWLEIKSLGESRAWSSVYRQEDEVGKLRERVPKGWHVQFRVSEKTTSFHVSALARCIDRLSLSRGFDKVCCLLTGDARSISRTELVVDGASVVAFFNMRSKRNGWPIEFYSKLPHTDICVTDASNNVMVAPAWRIFGGQDPETYLIAYNGGSGSSLGYAGGAVISKRRERAIDLLSDANGKFRNANRFRQGAGAVLFLTTGRDEDAIESAVLGQPIVAIATEESPAIYSRINSALNSNQNRAVAAVLSWDRGRHVKVLQNRYAESVIGRPDLARLVGLLTDRKCARKGALA